MGVILFACRNRSYAEVHYLPPLRQAGWAGTIRLAEAGTGQGAADLLAGAAGVLLTGGRDIHPRHWNAGEPVHPTADVDPDRDELEIPLVQAAWGLGLPILGICRGTQLTNVVLGGTLVPDLQRAGHQDHRSTPDGDRVHTVAVEQGTVLAGITGVAQGTVSSAHHQAVGRVGDGLRVTARSADGVIEALEWAVPEGRAFFQLVQWHPERMTERENPLQRHLIQHFAEAVNRHNT